MDKFIDTIESYLEQKERSISDAQLQRAVLWLPVLMYRLGDAIDRAAIDADIAKAATKAVYANAYLAAVGTIPERESHAELRAADEAVIVDLSKHVYQRLKMKLEHANSLFDGVRKIMSAHDTDKAVFGKEQRK